MKMSDKFSDLQLDKNGLTPQAILTDLAEQIQSGNIKALSVAYVDGDGYNLVRNWHKDGNTEAGRINSNLLISTTTFANLAAQGFVFDDEE